MRIESRYMKPITSLTPSHMWNDTSMRGYDTYDTSYDNYDTLWQGFLKIGKGKFFFSPMNLKPNYL